VSVGRRRARPNAASSARTEAKKISPARLRVVGGCHSLTSAWIDALLVSWAT